MRKELKGVVLDADRLAELAAAARTNAAAMIGDARLLLDAGSPARAHALTVLALEEVGKVNLCLSALFGIRSSAEVLELWGNHTEKLTQSHLLALLYAEHYPATSQVVERFEDVVKSDAALRLRGLYIDPTPEGIAGPDDISAAQAADVVALAEELVVVLQAMDLAGAPDLYSGADADLAREVMAQVEEQLAGAKAEIAAMPEPERADAERRLHEGVDAFVGDLRSMLIPQPGQP